jgi:hypothetical protein
MVVHAFMAETLTDTTDKTKTEDSKKSPENPAIAQAAVDGQKGVEKDSAKSKPEGTSNDIDAVKPAGQPADGKQQQADASQNPAQSAEQSTEFSSASRRGDSVAPRENLNVQNRGASPEFAGKIDDAMKSLPQDHQKTLADKGVQVRTISEFPASEREKGTHGVYDDKSRTITLSEGEHRRSGQDPTQTAWHEAGHALSDLSGDKRGKLQSDNQQFRDALNKDWQAMSRGQQSAARQEAPFLFNNDGKGGLDREEAFAQLYANNVGLASDGLQEIGLSGFNRTDATQFFPSAYAHVRDKFFKPK